jgi:copper chaperone CopZ
VFGLVGRLPTLWSDHDSTTKSGMAIDVTIRGMTCGGCVASLKKVLDREGLSDVTVELGVAHVPDARSNDVARVERAIEKAGFEVAASAANAGTTINDPK